MIQLEYPFNMRRKRTLAVTSSHALNFGVIPFPMFDKLLPIFHPKPKVFLHGTIKRIPHFHEGHLHLLASLFSKRKPKTHKKQHGGKGSQKETKQHGSPGFLLFRPSGPEFKRRFFSGWTHFSLQVALNRSR